jgi:hypothetical protein
VPLSLVSVVNDTLVASLVRVTRAPGTEAPLASWTVPVTRDVVPCPLAIATRPNVKSKNAIIGFLILVLGFKEGLSYENSDGLYISGGIMVAKVFYPFDKHG